MLLVIFAGYIEQVAQHREHYSTTGIMTGRNCWIGNDACLNTPTRFPLSCFTHTCLLINITSTALE